MIFEWLIVLLVATVWRSEVIISIYYFVQMSPGKRKGECSSQEDELLRQRSLNGRTSGPKRRSIKGQWTQEDDATLCRAVQQYKGKNWKKIAEFFTDRTDVQCLHRWQKVLNPELVKGPWSKEEDNIIIEMVSKYGAKKWSTIAQALPGRIGKQCRERWHNHLNPTIKKDAWSQEEEIALIHAHSIFGNKWAELSKHLPGRTDNAIKNHWHSSVKKKLESYRASGLLAQFKGFSSLLNTCQPSSENRLMIRENRTDLDSISECSQSSDLAAFSSQSECDMMARIVTAQENFKTSNDSTNNSEPTPSDDYFVSMEDVMHLPNIHQQEILSQVVACDMSNSTQDCRQGAEEITIPDLQNSKAPECVAKSTTENELAIADPYPSSNISNCFPAHSGIPKVETCLTVAEPTSSYSHSLMASNQVPMFYDCPSNENPTDTNKISKDNVLNCSSALVCSMNGQEVLEYPIKSYLELLNAAESTGPGENHTLNQQGNSNCAADGPGFGSLYYQPPRVEALDFPFASCDLITSKEQQAFSPLGIRKIMVSMWDSNDTPDGVLMSAVKNAISTPSVLKNRQRDLLSPLSENRVDKKIRGFYNASSLSREFSFQTDENMENQLSSYSVEDFLISPESQKKFMTVSKVCNEDGIEHLGVGSSAEILKENLDPFLCSQDRIKDLGVGSSDEMLRGKMKVSETENKPAGISMDEKKENSNLGDSVSEKQIFENLECMSKKGHETSHSETIFDISWLHSPLTKEQLKLQCASSSYPSSELFHENLNIFSDTPGIKRGIESPSTWKSPPFRFMNLPAYMDMDNFYEGVSYFMSPQGELHKPLASSGKHYSNWRESLKRQRSSKSTESGVPKHPNTMILPLEGRQLDFGGGGTTPVKKQKGSNSASSEEKTVSSSSHLLKKFR